jgi:hypothetical protein
MTANVGFLSGLDALASRTMGRKRQPRKRSTDLHPSH